MQAATALAHALEVEAFIASCKIEDGQGARWRRTEDPESKPVRTLYHGSAGIVLFYLELHRAAQSAADKTRFLEEARQGGVDLLSYLAAKEFITVGFYSGWPGYVFVLNELFKATGDTSFRAGAVSALEKLAAQATPLGAGIGWIEPMPFSDITGKTGDREVIDLSVGAAGAAVIFLYAHREGLHDKALDWAIQSADRLLEVAEHTNDGPRWLMMVDMPFPFTAPNFAHGGAGVGYVLADLYRETGNKAYLDAATGAASYVQSRSVPQASGHLVCHTEEQQPPSTFYLGVCHGPAGTGRLMYLLHEITGDAGYLSWLHDSTSGLLSQGVPENRTDGLWQNFGQCCGDAGIGDYALSLHRTTGRSEYLDLAQRIASNAIAQSRVVGAGRGWSQAEHRSRPDFLEVQTGYMQGAAGLGSFLLNLATHDQQTGAKIAMPETPF